MECLSFKIESALEIQLTFFTGILFLLINALVICISFHFHTRYVFLTIVTVKILLILGFLCCKGPRSHKLPFYLQVLKSVGSQRDSVPPFPVFSHYHCTVVYKLNRLNLYPSNLTENFTGPLYFLLLSVCGMSLTDNFPQTEHAIDTFQANYTRSRGH